jgi:uncharacterized protein (DUF983 family)
MTKKEFEKKMAASYEAARKVVATGCCPQCGAGLTRNLSLTGWWQCEQYGAVGFRKHTDLPSCSFQCFTK